MGSGGWGDVAGHGHPHTAVALGTSVLIALGALFVIKHLFGEIRAGAHVEV